MAADMSSTTYQKNNFSKVNPHTQKKWLTSLSAKKFKLKFLE